MTVRSKETETSIRELCRKGVGKRDINSIDFSKSSQNMEHDFQTLQNGGCSKEILSKHVIKNNGVMQTANLQSTRLLNFTTL